MALLVSIQPSSILNKTANYMRVSIVRYDLKATDCLARFDLLDSTGVNLRIVDDNDCQINEILIV